MLEEYRFIGIGPQGKQVQGTFTVGSLREARQHLAKLVTKYQI